MTGRHIIVVGAGIIGAAIAYELAKRGTAVTVLDRSAPATGATGQSFGWVNANAADSPEYFRLRRAAMDAHHELREELGDGIAAKWGGSLYWEVEGDELAREFAMLEEFGYPVTSVDRERFATLAPRVANAPEHCILSELEGAADPVAITGTLLKAAAELGAGMVFGCEVRGIVQNGSRITGVETSVGEMPCDDVVIAAGIFTRDLLATAGIRLPMDNRRGLIVHTAPVEPCIDHLILAPEIHFHQRADGVVLMGEKFSGETAPGDPVAFANELLNRLKARLPDVEGLAIDRIVLGVRPVPVDGHPAVGRVDADWGVYVASMHSGITLGPLIGRLAAAEILEDDRSDLLVPFRPTRFN